MLLALSWEFPKLTIFHLITLLSIGCPLIHEYNASSFVCASCQQLLAIGLSSLKFTNQPTSYTLLYMHMVLPFFVFSLCKHFHSLSSLCADTLLGQSSFILHLPSGTVSLAK